MKSAFRSAIPTTLAFSLRSSNPTMHRHRHRHPLTLLPLYAARCSPTPFPLTSMAGGESGTHAPPAPTVQSLEKQFEEFRHPPEAYVIAIGAFLWKLSRLPGSCTQAFCSVSPCTWCRSVLETAKGQIGLLRELFSKLAEITRECPGQYYRYHGDWRSETQTVVSLLAFMHWLETGSLLRHTEAEEKLGCINNNEIYNENFIHRDLALGAHMLLMDDCLHCAILQMINVSKGEGKGRTPHEF
ncbi:hypothetical protein Pfo_028766 [Paulownia fortunei]|nr:hypothetical protein Pfo_028766 [Paulownia fortunei]